MAKLEIGAGFSSLKISELLRKNKNANVFCKAIDNHRLFKLGFKHHVTAYCESL